MRKIVKLNGSDIAAYRCVKMNAEHQIKISDSSSKHD